MPTITQCKVFRPTVRTKLMAECESGSYQHDAGITYVTLYAPVKTHEGRLNTSDQYKITCGEVLLNGHALYQYTSDRGEMLFTILDP